MADAIATRLELQLSGVREAVAGLNQVGASSRQMAAQAETGGGKFASLSKTFGKIGGAGKFDFQILSGISEAIDGAQGSWGKFASSIGQTAMFGGAAIAIGAIINEAVKLSDETDKLYESLGQKAPGMFENWLTGWGMILGLSSGNPPPSSVGDTTAARQESAVKQGQDFLKTMKTENSPEAKYSKWLDENKNFLMGKGIHEREALERKQWEAIKEETETEKERAATNKRMSDDLAKGGKAGDMYFGGFSKQREAIEAYKKDNHLEGMDTEQLARALKPAKLASIIEDYVKKQENAVKAAADAAAKETDEAMRFANGIGKKVREGKLTGERDFAGELFMARAARSGMGPGIGSEDDYARAKGDVNKAEKAVREKLNAEDANRAALADRVKAPRFGGADTIGGAAAYAASNSIEFARNINPQDRANAQALTESQKQSRYQEAMSRALEAIERGSQTGSLFVIGAGNN